LVFDGVTEHPPAVGRSFVAIQGHRPRPEVSVIMPVFNEEAIVDALYRRVSATVAAIAESYELVFVDDGSSDGTAAALSQICEADRHVKAICLSRNFGHQAALMAGLDHVDGRAVVMMDGDLQHPPELIPELVERWRSGYDIVYTVRHGDQEGLVKRSTGRTFYALFRWVTRINLESGAADFRLLDRRVVDALHRFHERFLFFRGLVGWVGFRTVAVPYVAAARPVGASKYTLRRMTRLALDGLFSFSTLPLRLAIWCGLAVAIAGAAYAVFALHAALRLHSVVPGWTSLMVVVLLLGGVQLMIIGILGEYIGRVYEEVKGRPVYLVREVFGGDERAQGS
jgi:dolichol-phosphate mannosyltransferase